MWHCLNDLFKYCRKVPAFVSDGEIVATDNFDHISVLKCWCAKRANHCSETLTQHYKSTKFPDPNPRHFHIYSDGSKCEQPLSKIKEKRRN